MLTDQLPRLNGGGNPLPANKQKWLNEAYRSLRHLRDTENDSTRKTAITDILACLILVDGE